MSGRRQLTRDQEKAIFARKGGGGGGGGSRSGSSGGYDSPSAEVQSALDRGSSGGSELRAPSWGDNYIAPVLAPVGRLLHDPQVRENVLNSLSALATVTGGSALLTQGLSKLGAIGRGLASWKTPLAAIAGSYGLDSYRDSHTTMDPKLDHALAATSQGLKYTAALTGLAKAKAAVGSELGKWDIAVHGASGSKTMTAAEALAAPFKKIGDAMTSLGKAIGSKIPGPVAKPLDWLYKAYTNAAEFTGSSLSDVGQVGTHRRALEIAGEMRTQAALIETKAGQLASADQAYALDLLDRAHQLARSNSSNASALYKQAADLYHQNTAGLQSSKESAKAMMDYADTLSAQAKYGLLKAAAVVTGIAAKEGYDEYTIGQMQQEARQAWEEGRDWGIEAEQPRTGYDLAMAIAAGTMGNPIEKQFRYGQDEYKASVAAYRAAYDAVKEEGQRAGWSDDRLEKELAAVARTKPGNMAGKALWTFAPAAAAFGAWKAGDYLDRVRATGPAGTVTRVRDADTIEINNDPTGIRWTGINTPEIDHGPGKPAEYLGDEATDWQRGQLDGKTVRLVYTHDKNGPLVGKDIYGRDLAYVETLPRPFDKLLAIPGIGKFIPAQDQNLKTIEAGYALPKQAFERLAGGQHDRRYEYDEAAARAIASGVGVNDRAAGAESGLGQIPTYTPFEERKRKRLKDQGYDVPDTPTSNLATMLGLGLMGTGQSGVFREMGPSGNLAAQSWNASLAVLGAGEQRQRASQNPAPRRYQKPKSAKSEGERNADQILERYTRGR